MSFDVSSAPPAAPAHRLAQPLSTLLNRGEFIDRHVGPDTDEIADMLGCLELGSLDDLVRAAVPAHIVSDSPLALPPPVPEHEALRELRAMLSGDRPGRSFIGLGYYDTWTPTVIQRNVLENPGWYTAYTPYQPEISQGRLECLLSFQQMVIDLTAMDLANASLLDEATAAAEGMTLARRVSAKRGTQTFFVDRHCFPQTIDVVRTRARGFGFELVVDEPEHAARYDVFGALLQYPSMTGEPRDLSDVIEQLHAQQAVAVVAADLLSLVLLKPPGEMGADVVVGSTQRFGVPLGYGGPHAAYFATREAHKRALPGRLIGVSVDARGRPAYRMALQTREQHIRREKANSNVCTSQVLLANVAALYAIYHGPKGLTRIASRIARLTAILAIGLEQRGMRLLSRRFFDTLTLMLPLAQGRAIAERARDAGVNVRIDDDSCSSIGISLDECTEPSDIELLWRVLLGDEAGGLSVRALDDVAAECTGPGIPEGLRRQSPFLTHARFNSFHSETGMLRYLKRLEEKDISLTRSMIPLGSCTMKLNASTEMMPISWPEIARVHPFAPADRMPGYQSMIHGLGRMLAVITGFDAVSMQPNSGAQGEYAGLLAIRRYHASRDESRRDVCLIPHSAHGTNPASARMVGLRVVIVACDTSGNIDREDLEAKAAEHADRLAALMLTYPSTHGVYEQGVKDVCRIVHEHGGQVYMDGANLNALVGISKPAEIGADVSHVNLHKTFCIPHGGGGPGMGPIGVKAHLAPFLPGHVLADSERGDAGGYAVSAAPSGSASILPISWMYIRMMGAAGLKRATQVAILNANYVAKRLEPHYPVLYTGVNGLVAHECIIDLRPLKATSGVSEEDIAKRLMDFGYHAPTMSFPVPGTLMIEPTESESKDELDRFIEAMIAIRHEIAQIERGEVDPRQSPLKHAPHTLDDLLDEGWDLPYDRRLAAFPARFVEQAKYWPPVNRVDQAYGDRHLFCACPPIDELE